MRRSIRVMCAASVVAVLGACSGLPWAERDAQLYSPVNGGVRVGQIGLAGGDSLTEGSIPVCVDVAGSVSITSVEPVEPLNGLSVTAFAVRTIPVGVTPLGDARGGLSAMGLDPEQQKVRTVSNICGEQSRANVGLDGPPPSGAVDERVELVVTVTATTVPAGAEALRIRYTDASGDERSTTSAFGIYMCPGEIGDACPAE